FAQAPKLCSAEPTLDERDPAAVVSYRLQVPADGPVSFGPCQVLGDANVGEAVRQRARRIEDEDLTLDPLVLAEEVHAAIDPRLESDGIAYPVRELRLVGDRAPDALAGMLHDAYESDGVT